MILTLSFINHSSAMEEEHEKENVAKRFFDSENNREIPNVPSLEDIPDFVADMVREANGTNGGIQHILNVLSKKKALEVTFVTRKGYQVRILDPNKVREYLLDAKKYVEEVLQEKIDY